MDKVIAKLVAELRKSAPANVTAVNIWIGKDGYHYETHCHSPSQACFSMRNLRNDWTEEARLYTVEEKQGAGIVCM